MRSHRVTDKPTFIYTLTDPRDGLVFYVGKTVYSLSHRLSCHISNARAGIGTNADHIQGILSCCMTPSINQIDLVNPGCDWVVVEQMWIAKFRKTHVLTNKSSGGQGVTGYKFPKEIIARVVASRKANPNYADTLRRISASRTGRKCSPEEIEKRASKMRGRKQRPEVVAKMAALRKGKKIPDHVRAAAAAARANTPCSEEYREGCRVRMRARAKECSARMKEQWNDPEWRAARSAESRARRASEETRAKVGAASARAWQREESRARRIESLSAALNAPEHKQLKSEIGKAKWADPEWRAKMLEARASARARKRAVALS